MRTIILAFTLFMGLYFAEAANTTKVLFIGNSITYFNDMPQIFESIANDLGQSVEVTMHAPGGTGFANHVSNPAVYDLFREGHWDYIVLQPGTGDSGGEAVGGTPIETSLERIRTLLDSAYLYNPCSQVLFFEISNGVTGTSASDLSNYNAIMDLIHSNVQFFSDSTMLPFAPVGEAFSTFWNNELGTLLWNSYNDIHPNAKGSYLAACVFYTSIFQSETLGCNILNGMNLAEVEQLQTIADTLVLNHLEEWNINTFNQHTEFTYDIDDNLVTFNNLSENIDSLIWHFGDGNNSIISEPSHLYANLGNYPVQLISYQHRCMDTASTDISIISLDILETSQTSALSIYPNPAHNYIQVDSENNNKLYYIYNSKGQLVKQSSNQRLNISNFPNGVYYLRTDDGLVVRWLKE